MGNRPRRCPKAHWELGEPLHPPRAWNAPRGPILSIFSQPILHAAFEARGAAREPGTPHALSRTRRAAPALSGRRGSVEIGVSGIGFPVAQSFILIGDVQRAQQGTRQGLRFHAVKAATRGAQGARQRPPQRVRQGLLQGSLQRLLHRSLQRSQEMVLSRSLLAEGCTPTCTCATRKRCGRRGPSIQGIHKRVETRPLLRAIWSALLRSMLRSVPFILLRLSSSLVHGSPIMQPRCALCSAASR